MSPDEFRSRLTAMGATYEILAGSEPPLRYFLRGSRPAVVDLGDLKPFVSDHVIRRVCEDLGLDEQEFRRLSIH